MTQTGLYYYTRQEVIAMIVLTRIGIVICITQSATLSGLNLAFFSVSKLRLELEASNFRSSTFTPYRHCHRPIIVRDKKAKLGEIITRLKVHPEHRSDDVIDEDIILMWTDEKRVITGSDILGQLLRCIVENEAVSYEKNT